jgi:hypothetical protein
MEQQPQFAAWTHYAEAGESSWHKRWLSLTQSNLLIYKSDKPGTKPLFSFSLSSIVTKKLASNFERRHSAVVFTLMRNFIISFSSQPELESAISIIIRVQESALGVELSALVAGCAGAASEISVSGGATPGASTPQPDSASLAKHLAKERSNRCKLFAQAAAGAPVPRPHNKHRNALAAMSAQRAADALALCVQHEVDMQVQRAPAHLIPFQPLSRRPRWLPRTACKT